MEEANTKQHSKPRHVLVFIALLLALIAIVIALISYNNLRHDWQRIQEENAQITQSLTQFNQLNTQLQNQLQGQESKLGGLNDTLQHLSQIMAPIESASLLQAEYLTQLAQLNLKYQSDVSGALALLKMADQRLSVLSSPSILEVRQLLAKHIAALQAVPAVDLAGIVTKLNAISDEINKLPLVPEFPRKQTVLQPSPQKTTKLDTYLANWRDALSTSWHTLERVVIIRRHGQPIEPLLAPEQFLYLKQNLQLQIQQAQWAALHQQQIIYVLSLQRAANWVNYYFTDNNLVSRAVQQSLGELQKVTVQPVLPDISSVVTAIRQAQQHVAASDKSATSSNKPGARS